MKAAHPVDRLFTRTAALSALGIALCLTGGAAVAGVDLQAQTFAQLLTAVATIAIALATLRAAQAAAESTQHAAAAAEAARTQVKFQSALLEDAWKKEAQQIENRRRRMREAVVNLVGMPPGSVLIRAEPTEEPIYHAFSRERAAEKANSSGFFRIAELIEGPALRCLSHITFLEQQALNLLAVETTKRTLLPEL